MVGCDVVVIVAMVMYLVGAIQMFNFGVLLQTGLDVHKVLRDGNQVVVVFVAK